MREELSLGQELLEGYAGERAVPEASSLRWHVAATLLVRARRQEPSRFDREPSSGSGPCWHGPRS